MQETEQNHLLCKRLTFGISVCWIWGL